MKAHVLRHARVWLAVLLLLSILLNATWVALNAGALRDYGSFIAAGKASSTSDNPYGVYENTFRVRYGDFDVDTPNLNPPVSIYPFKALAQIDPYAGKTLLNLSSIAVFAGVIAALMRAYPDKRTPMMLLWALSLAGFWHAIELGQVYMPLLAAVTAAWLLQDRRPVLAGLLIGLTIALKPNFVVWPLLLLLGGDRKTGAAALATAAGISAIPLLIDGPRVYRQWLEASQDFGGLELPGNSAIVAMFARAGLPEAGIAVSVALALALAVWAWRSGASKQELSAAGITGALLLGPITWSGYSLFVLPVLLSRQWGNWERATATLLAFPFWLVLLLMLTNQVTYMLLGPVYGWGLLIMLGLIAGDTYRRKHPAAQDAATPATGEPAALAA